jgi:hypothetical protein
MFTIITHIPIKLVQICQASGLSSLTDFSHFWLDNINTSHIPVPCPYTTDNRPHKITCQTLLIK